MNSKTLLSFFLILVISSSQTSAFATPTLNMTMASGQTTTPVNIFDFSGNILFKVFTSATILFQKFIQFDNTGLTAVRNYRFPDSSGTLPVLNATQTFTGANTFSHNTNTFTTKNTGLIISNPAGSLATTLAGGAVTANRTLNLPAINGTDTLGALGKVQTWTATQTFSEADLNGLDTSVVTKTGAYTITGTDSTIFADATSAGFTITLPSASVDTGQILTVKKIDTTNNIVKLAAVSSQRIDGSGTTGYGSYNMTTQDEGVGIQSDGSNWRVITRSLVSPTAQLSSTVSQAPTNTTANVVTMNSNDFINGGITHSTSISPQKVTVNEAGIYLIVASGQFGHTTGGTACTADLWLRNNGVDIANTNTRYFIATTLADTNVLVSQAVLALKQGDIINIEFSISATGQGCGLINTAPAGEADIPAIIFSITKISDR